MRLRFRSLAIAASVVVAGIAAPAATGGSVACASEGPRAGLVVDTGARVIQLCVRLDAEEVTGLRLIQLASAQHGLSYAFGMGGAAVCRLDGVGPAGGDCFAVYPEYWGYWHGDGSGGWTWASTGAGSYRVGDGDLEGWVWGTGDTGTTHGRPPALAFDDLCAPATEPSPEPSETPGPTSRPKPGTSATASPTTSRTTTTETSSRPVESGSTSSDRTHVPSPTAPPTPSTTAASPALAVSAPPPDGGGPPAGLFLAVALALLLGLGGWLRLRPRSGRSE